MKKMRILFASLLMLVFALSCGKAAAPVAEEGKTEKINVVATVNFFRDLVEVIGGEKVNAIGLMGEGVDPHLYNASAGDVEKLTNADVVVYGGLHLEGKMGEIFEKLESTGKVVLNLGDSLNKDKIHYGFEDDASAPDPHVWFSTELWADEARAVTETLSKYSPENKEYFEENLKNYLVELDEATKYVQSRINEIPEKSRVLITAHDAFGYFADQFGLKVEAIQGVSTDSETSTKRLSELADFIVKNEIKAIFVESSVPKKSIEALQEAVKSKGKIVEIGGELYADSLGDKENNAETYIKTLKANADIITEALK